MKTVIIDTKNPKISISNQTLVVDNRKIPFNLIENILIFSNCTLNTKDINKIILEGKNIILVDYKLNSTLITSTKAKNSQLKINQYNAYINKRLQIAKSILSLKIISHINHLKNLEIFLNQEEILQKIENANNIETLLGVEGSFSKLYFDNFFLKAPKLWHKSKRSKRPPKDALNALLSFGYTLYYNHIAIFLVTAGFEPSIGFLHTPFRSHFALASDILEIFRADINAFMLEQIKREVVTLKDFTKKDGVYLRYEGRKKLYKNWQEFVENSRLNLTKILYDLKESFND